ncbi:uncharacterized protein [Temnothorax longispinosus]|uniref:uncharacterized protein n=1 Tax=Temnothorax longispinosus TaxID=300112 RepID=UPI003A990473
MSVQPTSVIKEAINTDIDRIRIIMIGAIVRNVLADMAIEESIIIPMVIIMTDGDDIQDAAPVVNNVQVKNVLEALIRRKMIIVVIHTMIVDHEEARYNAAGEQNQVALTDQVVQSGQVAQRSTPVQGLNQSEEKSSSAGIQKEPDLAPEILQAIGERVHPDRKLAPAIHTKFVAGIEEVIKKGLPADKKKGLLEKFPSPENCLMMDPPKLNPELKACLQETITKRDSRIVEKQARITTSLAGLLDVLVKITSLKSEEKLPTKELTESLWGVLQLMADLQHVESSVRRSLIVKNINASMRETLNATTVGEWLFGEKLEEKVKAAKTLEYSSKSLKPNTQQNQTGQSKNSKRPLRRQPSKWTRNSASSGRRPYQSYQKQKQPSRQSTQLKDNQSVAKKQE